MVSRVAARFLMTAGAFMATQIARSFVLFNEGAYTVVMCCPYAGFHPSKEEHHEMSSPAGAPGHRAAERLRHLTHRPLATDDGVGYADEPDGADRVQRHAQTGQVRRRAARARLRHLRVARADL